MNKTAAIKQELEKKREQLAELKRRKRERELEKESKSEIATQTNSFPYSNTYIANTPTSHSSSTSLNTLFSSSKSHHSLADEFANLNVTEIINKVGLSSLSTNNTISTSSTFSISVSSSTHSFQQSDDTTLYYDKSPTKKLQDLSLTPNPNKVNIYPHEPITYSKETQTLNDYDLPPSNENSDTDSVATPRQKRRKAAATESKPLAYYDDFFVYDTIQWEDEFECKSATNEDANSQANTDDLAKHLNLENLSFLEAQLNLSENSFFHSDPNNTGLIGAIQNLDLDQGESEDIIHGPTVKYVHTEAKLFRFLERKRPLIERCLNQNIAKNIFFDYSASSQLSGAGSESNRAVLKLKKTFSSTVAGAVVTCLDWSQQYPELVMCAYDDMSLSYEEAACESLLAVWNTTRTDVKTPQQTFTCTSLITACCFASFNSNVIVGGTYSGQIVMWDLRCNKSTPIQRSALSVLAHVNPVYSVKILDQKDSHHLITTSNDGKLCTWSLENLNQPIETTELYLKNTNRNIYATCMDFQTPVDTSTISASNEEEPHKQEMSKFKQFAVVGAEDGLAHTLSINGSKFTTTDVFNDHLGPVTAVSCYNQCRSGMNEFSYKTNESLSHLFLTSSFDSTVKLWDAASNSTALHTFECNGEYVFDVCWSPIHPSLFACVDGAGKLDLWDLNKDTEMPSASADVGNHGPRALNKVKWSRKGTEIAVGDDQGQISIFEVGENFARPGADETNKLLSTVYGLKQLSYETGKTDLLSYYSNSTR